MTSVRAATCLALAALAAGGCGGSGGTWPDGGQPVDFVIAGMRFHVSDGAVSTSGSDLVFYLSDQPDACLAVTQTPAGTAMLLTLRIAPVAGTPSATVVPPSPPPPLPPAPSPGQAMGGLVKATGGVQDASVDAASGNLAWTVNGDGSVTIGSIDVVFAASAGELATYGLRLRPCP